MMKSDQSGKYLIYWVSTIVVLLLLTSALNWFVDPFGIYYSPDIRGLNVSKPQITDYSRLYKAYNVAKVKPNTVILGTSLAWTGIDPEHPAWSDPPVYNLAFNSAWVYEIARYLQHAQNIHPLKQALILLDFYSFNTEEAKGPDYDEAYLSIDYSGQSNPFSSVKVIVQTMFSYNALKNTFITLGANIIGWQKYQVLDNGMEVRTSADTDYNTSFIRVTRNFVRPVENYQFDRPGTDPLPFEAYRKILRMAYHNDIDLRLVISPFHVYHWETLEARGLWPEFETWKRKLVVINQEESELAGRAPLLLWDFAEYSEYTTEDVPPKGSNMTMKWYIDSAHFTTALGDLMLNKVYGYQPDSQESLDDFGMIITPDNIEAHLSEIRQKSEQYRMTHYDDIAAIENMVKDINN
jgi:hypothetical protein